MVRRYLALVQAIVVVVLTTLSRTSEEACDAMRYLPFG